MKILISSEWYAPNINGVVTSLVTLENELRKQGHELRILTLSLSKESYVSGAVTHIASRDAAWVYPNARFTLKKTHPLMDELIKWCPDIIHSQTEFSTFLMARKIAKACRCPIVHTYHTVYEDYTHYIFPGPVKVVGRKLASGLTRLLLNHLDAVIAPTAKTLKILERYKVKTPIRVIPTGIDLNRFQIEKDDPKVQEIRSELKLNTFSTTLVYLGRLGKEKNIEEILTFLAKSVEPGLGFLIVGGGPYLTKLEETVKSLKIEDSVRFSGMAKPEEVPYYYAAGDLFVSASQSETQGLTYIEALASGLPALCKKDECLEGVIIDEENGWQYESLGDFFSHLHQFMEEPELRERMIENARQSALKRFSAERFATEVYKLYEEILAIKKDKT